MQNNKKKVVNFTHFNQKKNTHISACTKSSTDTPQNQSPTPQKATKNQTQPHIDTPTKIESIFVNLWMWIGAWKSTRMSLSVCGGDQNVWVDRNNSL